VIDAKIAVIKCVCFAHVCECARSGKHVVFGQVVEGYSVVKAMEAVGSRSGATALPVVVKDCGVVGELGSAQRNVLPLQNYSSGHSGQLYNGGLGVRSTLL
jgi:cyclophilin family peptidyl-prolyl cis-trans isomerase